MFRLNKSAFEILNAELRRCNTNDVASQVQQQIVLKRLEKLRLQTGTPLTEDELRETLNDLFPNFNPKVLKQAAKANRPPSALWNSIKLGTIAVGGIAGGIWFLNLPYPMIRYPVARVMPMVLLPSFMSMDHHYRQAIATTEQADQLVNNATSSADFDLGATRVKTAQQHLDALPVWFLGYYPSAYCGWFGCSWRFTLDEFQQARKNVARMDARLFQEKNAQTQLQQANTAVNSAKQSYQAAPNQARKDDAIAQWQQGMDRLQEVPGETLAGRTAQTKLKAYERDFQQLVGFSVDNERSGNLIQAAQFSAATAANFSTGKAQGVEVWQEAEKLWNEAISTLETIKSDDPDYVQARKLLSQYQLKLSSVRIRLKQEQESAQAFEQAQQLQISLLASVRSGAKTATPQQISQLRQIEKTLRYVKQGTTVYPVAQNLLKAAQKRLQPIGG
ncbi:hypothetical protein JOY44_16965 [Phormidium sp. CLA17]|uniref:hypothetical protein n=1 Tax=Leptolyngbya sp. Cla-17 TaxID=2803751 RepID=UPI001490A210|nr:hypothetical protein [Leptolyngbya sp. Cla-17]MBM0743283.1 hypothetical protein [Leptolyngbya sp. Cla-17]